jgi:ribonuclease HI
MPGEITIYTDGAASGNPGPGGYGTILIAGPHRLEKSEGYKLTTNNRMELLAVIAGLEALKIPGSRVVVYTDSRYVADSVEKGWVFGWEKKRFRKRKNSDLWIRFLDLYRKHSVRFVWVKGHADNPENNNCDRLATEAAKKTNLLADEGYSPDNEDEELLID